VLANIVPDRNWLATMLHELGHSVYSSKNIPAALPYTLRTDAHPLSTEAVAMMFGAFASDAGWLEAMGVKVPDRERFARTAAKVRRNERLIFSRWCQVMFRFEMGLYNDPDQDLNRLWWDLVEKYQEVPRPAERNQPDYASKIHMVVAPVYYHNYQMGDLYVAQLRRAIARDALGGADPAQAGPYVGNRAVGRFMQERVFQLGRTVNWNELARRSTGEELNPRAFAESLRVK
jgi:peptidyl-dipeptidase A